MAAGRKKKRFSSGASRPRIPKKAKEILAWGAMLFLAALWQAAPNGWPTICGGRPLLLVPLVASVAMFVGPAGGAAAGVTAGLLWDLYSNHLFGVNALLLMILGCAVSLLTRLLLRNNFLSALMITGGAVVAHALCEWLLYQVLPLREGAVSALLHITLPNAVYTFVLALPVYAAVRLAAKLLKD